MAALSLLCDTEVSKCSPQALVDFLGSKNNGQSPVQLNSQITNSSTKLPDG